MRIPAARKRAVPVATADAGGVRVSNLTRTYAERVVLRVDELNVERGEFVALIGRSGSGKSTMLRALAGLDGDVEGTGELEVPQPRCVLFQDSRLLPWASVLANVTLAMRSPDAVERALASLVDVGLNGRQDAYPNALSGGEQQRVALARSLVRDPKLLLADEPFGALDALTRLRMHALMRRLVAEHQPTVVLVTHDVDEALALGQRILVLEAGRIILDHRPPAQPTAEEYAHERHLLLEALGVDPAALSEHTGASA